MNRNPEFETAYTILDVTRGQNKLWHRISLEGFKNVLACGEIHANIYNRYEVTYGQSTHCLARHFQAISLFDFDSSSVEQIIDQECKWVHFLKDFEPLTIVMGIDRNLINSKDLIYPMTIPYEQILKQTKEGMDYVPTFIPYVEVLHQSSIPVSYINEILITKYGGKGFFFQRVPLDADTISYATKLLNEWTLELEDEKANSPMLSLTDIVSRFS